ncbi:toxin-antitoxin system YwqK family antitoxin [Psychroserpens damuponensis]|uniref:toxin-antitoxin system YwqK family antitoxin n=1 Tax=Psychroserpens damuponensis TaxID=943936 RepID=UPI00058B5FD4|nr:hypothetical protein [Psychroserpens damuponensis]
MKIKYFSISILLLILLNSCKDERIIISEKWDNGITKEEKKWINKELDSYIELTYYENGQIGLEKHYNDGKLNVFKSYYETGEISALVMYHNEVSIFGAEYYKNGQIMGSVPTNLNGKINGTITYFYENGNLRGKQKYLNNKPVGNSKEYDLNGKLISE